MSSILESREFGGIILCLLAAFIFHYLGKWLRKDKLKSEEEFEKFIAENSSPKKIEYNYKKFDMDYPAQNYRHIWIMKYSFILGAIVFLLLLIFSNR
ncbi:MAG: hypothetical protein QM710_13775 [Flavobacterium sp.]